MPAAIARPLSSLEKPRLIPEPTVSGMLGSGISVKGSVVSDDDLYVDGEVEGSIKAIQSTLTVGPNARVAARIMARRIVILGTVRGLVTALESVALGRTCNLVGDVTTSRIAIEDGAYFKGSIDIAQPSSSSEAVAFEERYSKLVDQKYLRGLTESEEAEYASMAVR